MPDATPLNLSTAREARLLLPVLERMSRLLAD